MGFVDICFNGILASNFGVYIKNKTIPAAKEIVQELAVPGRDGSLFVRKRTYESTTIKVDFNYTCEENAGEIWRAVKQWLLGKNGELYFSDDTNIFYQISNVTVSELHKQGNYIYDFTVIFTTKDGLSYLHSGKKEYEITELFNPGIFSKPIWKITGEGVCTIAVNGNTVIAHVLGDIIIDSEKMIAYRSDGLSQNTAIKGEYEDLFLESGENIVTVTDGFECKAIPNWRCL